MKKLNIQFDYTNDGIAYDADGCLDRPFSYSPEAGMVYTWDGWKIHVDSEAKAKEVIEQDIVRTWPSEYADLYSARYKQTNTNNIMENTLKLSGKNDHGKTFNVKYVRPNENRWHDDSDHFKHYGGVPNKYDEALVLIFDTEYDFHPEGQFVTAYCESTILEHEDGFGIRCQGDEPSWDITEWHVDQIKAFIVAKQN